jgi:Tfp pilus assembly protein PilW
VSLLEIVISMIILALVLVGLLNVFMFGKQYILHARMRISAAELGRYFLDPLQQAVRADTWDSASLNNSLVVGNFTGNSEFIGGVFYTPRYSIDNKTLGSSTLRRVQVTIGWNETPP